MAPLRVLLAVVLIGASAPTGGAAPNGAVTNPAPTASPRPLRLIGRVRAITTFCKDFATHFNGAVVPLLAADEQIGYVDYTMGQLDAHFHGRVPEQQLYDDRVKLIHYLKELFAQIPPAQSEINALRETAKSTSDPVTAKETHDLAANLQAALDKQHQLALDSLGVVHAMTDIATGTNLDLVPRPIDGLGTVSLFDDPKANPNGTPQPLPGSYDPAEQRMPKDMRDVRNILSFHKQRDRIGVAEGAAAQTADSISDGC